MFSILKTLILCMVISFPSLLKAEWNFDEMIQDFVLETKKIDIPGYAGAFNPSIVPYHDAYLMCFRIRDVKAKATNRIGMVWLDKEFKLLSPAKVLNLRYEPSFTPKLTQDPRLVICNEKIFIVFNDVVPLLNEAIRRIFIARVYYDGNNFLTDYARPQLYFEGANDKQQEKNWAPFAYEGNLLLSYSLSPHRVFKPILDTQSCETYSVSDKNITWDWGTLRGGTPALKEDNEYLAFFHSCKHMGTVQSKGQKLHHYFMGAYTFSATPPFAIRRMSRIPIFGKDFYNGPSYKMWQPLLVVFPTGFVSNKDFVWVTYGRQDHEIWVVKLDKRKLLKSLIPIGQ
jgi:predicted GH43/DUF377 family glycosyl hydrolase